MSDYDTELSPEQQQAYEAWAKAGGKDPEQEQQDYDLKGYYLKSGGAPLEGGHLTDEFKKPSHPTFSSESRYNGVGGAEGGQWGTKPDGSWTFTPGRTNMENWGPQGLQNYFNTYEPGNQLILPPEAN